jgi:hypothetical protein
MSGAIPVLPQYAFMAWCLVKAQEQLSQDHITGPYHEPDESNQHLHILFRYIYFNDSPSCQRFLSDLLLSGFPTEILYVFVSRPMRATCPPSRLH